MSLNVNYTEFTWMSIRCRLHITFTPTPIDFLMRAGDIILKILAETYGRYV